MNIAWSLDAEETRLQTLHGLRVLGTGADPTLDGLVRTAARIAQVPIATVSLIDRERQWFKSQIGLLTHQTPREIAFCAHTVQGQKPLIVNDATLDPRFAGNPLVTNDPNLRFYAGIPLVVDGQAIGALCVIDQVPRDIDADTLAALVDLARAVEHWMVSWREHETLRQRELEFRHLAEHLPAIVYRAEVEPPNAMLYVSPHVAQLGVTPDDWIDDPQARIQSVHPEDREHVNVDRAVSLAFGDHVRLDYRMLDADGNWRHYLDVAHVFRPDDGTSPYLQGMILDISDRVAADRKAREAEAYWRGLFAQLPDGVLVLDTNQRLVDANPQAASMLGYSIEELRQLKLQDLLDDATQEVLDEEARQVFAGDTFVGERVYRHRDGRRLTIEVRASAPVENRYVKVLRDVTQRRAQDAQLRKLSQAVEQSSESICISDLEGTIEYVNAAGVANSGYSRQELIGANSRILHSGKTPRETHDTLWKSLTAGQAWEGLFYNRRKDGSEFIERAVITPVQAEDGRITHYLAVKKDVTEKQRMSDELDQHRHHLEELVEQRTADFQQAKRAAEAASEAKSTFLAAMSHEIRTPMNGVVGMVEVLRQSKLTADQLDITGTIRDSAFSLLRILDDVLDVSKIEAGRLALELEPVDIKSVIEHTCRSLEPVAAGRGVGLQLFVDPQLPEQIISDGIRLRQILNNLIGNAIKFSSGLERQGRVRIHATLVKGNLLQIRILDNGIGISPEARQRIFDPFVQGESTTTRRYGGSGLGLAICHRLVGLFCGTIDVTSTPDIGAIFTVTLPMEIDAAPAATAGTPDLSAVECHLMLRDEQLVVDWCAYLNGAGARALGPSESGLCDWTVAPPVGTARVIITDALESLDKLAFGERGVRRACGIVTLVEGQRRNPRLDKSGMVSLDSPVLQRASLLQAVAIAAGLDMPTLEQSAAALPLVNGEVPGIEEAAALGRLILVAEDNDINQKVIKRQLALLGLAVETVGNGLEALQRVRSGRYALLLTDLHMPRMDGYELTQSVRQEESSAKHLPIIAISANALRGEAERCRAAGMDDYLSKPVQLDQLSQVLARWLPGTTTPSASQDAEPATGAAAPSVFFDDKALAKLIGNDPALLADFHNDYIGSANRALKELRTDATNGAWSAVGDVAHRFKSPSRAVGALGIGECCERIEGAARAKDATAVAKLLSELESMFKMVVICLTSVPEKPAEVMASRGEPCVLVVDDEAFESALLEQQLNALGIDAVHTCNSGLSALKWVQRHDTSSILLLLDLNMPDMDGVELIRHLAERNFVGTLALVSGADERVLETAAKLAEAHHLNLISHLRKPVTPESLRKVVTRWRSGESDRPAPHTRKIRSAHEVRQAIECNELVLCYQPKVSLKDGSLVGVEALVRWQHPTDGLLAPDVFVEVAETHGLIDALTKSVINQSLEQLNDWRKAGLELTVAVNVSMRNLSQLSFPDYVLSEISRFGLAPADLMLEVTESQLLLDARAPMDILTRLRMKCIRLSIDDFGTGHSSLTQLRDLPFDELKIDRNFVHGTCESATQQAIFRASLDMAHHLKMTAVAEGVEDFADWEYVRAARCDIAQGYFIGRPMPAQDLPAWSAQWQRRFKEL